MSKTNPLTIKGLWEFQEALSKLPETLTDDAADIVSEAAFGASGETYVAYPNKSGDLRRGLRVEVHRTKSTASAVLRSASDHASDYEKGTPDRFTRRGWKRGAMPTAKPGTAMIPIAQKWRRRMTENLITLVERAGFTVERS